MILRILMKSFRQGKQCWTYFGNQFGHPIKKNKSFQSWVYRWLQWNNLLLPCYIIVCVFGEQVVCSRTWNKQTNAACASSTFLLLPPPCLPLFLITHPVLSHLGITFLIRRSVKGDNWLVDHTTHCVCVCLSLSLFFLTFGQSCRGWHLKSKSTFLFKSPSENTHTGCLCPLSECLDLHLFADFFSSPATLDHHLTTSIGNYHHYQQHHHHHHHRQEQTSGPTDSTYTLATLACNARRIVPSTNPPSPVVVFSFFSLKFVCRLRDHPHHHHHHHHLHRHPCKSIRRPSNEEEKKEKRRNWLALEHRNAGDLSLHNKVRGALGRGKSRLESNFSDPFTKFSNQNLFSVLILFLCVWIHAAPINLPLFTTLKHFFLTLVSRCPVFSPFRSNRLIFFSSFYRFPIRKHWQKIVAQSLIIFWWEISIKFIKVRRKLFEGFDNFFGIWFGSFFLFVWKKFFILRTGSHRRRRRRWKRRRGQRRAIPWNPFSASSATASSSRGNRFMNICARFRTTTIWTRDRKICRFLRPTMPRKINTNSRPTVIQN